MTGPAFSAAQADIKGVKDCAAGREGGGVAWKSSGRRERKIEIEGYPPPDSAYRTQKGEIAPSQMPH